MFPSALWRRPRRHKLCVWKVHIMETYLALNHLLGVVRQPIRCELSRGPKVDVRSTWRGRVCVCVCDKRREEN